MLHLSDWADKVEAEVPGLVQEMLPPHLRPAAPEVWPYLTASLGDKTRMTHLSRDPLACVASLIGRVWRQLLLCFARWPVCA